jgi:hypothetical protein
MNENMKSLVFVGVAAVAALAAFFARPSSGSIDSVPIEKTLFADFKDPTVATSLEIVKPDAASSTVQTFKVQQENGLWVIPSSSNYPADAKDRLKNAATALIGLDVIGVATDKQSEHELYGVVQPDSGKALSNLKGVGTMIAVKDAGGKDLASLIIGKSPKGQPDQHFVRRPSQDRVYVTKINPDQVSAKFEDWIEKDLLNLNPLDVSGIDIKNYAVLSGVDPNTNRRVRQKVPRADLMVKFDEKENKWVPGKMTVYAMKEKVEEKEAPLTETEELNSEALDALKTALDNLQIAGVRRKPAGFSADLSADKSFADNEEALQSLMGKGFFPVPNSAGELEIYGTDGEMHVLTKDGVQYILRFGAVDQGEDGKATTASVNRYMLVTAKLNPEAIPPPVLEPEPAGPEAPKTEAKKEEEKKEGDKPQDDPKKQDDVAAEAKRAQERERIKKENERKTSEYSQKLNKAKSRISELNYRFANWYYLVSDDTFKKMNLTRSDIVKETANAAKEGFGIDAFRALQREGVNPPPEMPKLPNQPPRGGRPSGGFPGLGQP